MKADWIKAFLLGVLVALVAVMVFTDRPLRSTAYGADGGATNGMIALVGENNDFFLVDTQNRRVAVYDFDSNTGELLLQAARNVTFDLKVKTEVYNDDGLTVADIAR
jgi:hypothetical protein